MPKIKVTITGGKVHDVAYRPFLLSVAEGFGIDRFFAKNIMEKGKEVVEAHVEGDATKIKAFKEFASNNFPENARVDDVSVSDYDGPVMGVESYYRYLTASQLSKIGSYGGQMLEKQDQTIMAIKSVKEDTSAMLEKQDRTIMAIKSVKEDTSAMLNKQDQTISVIREESEKTRGELSTVIKDEGNKTRNEHVKTRKMSAEIFHSEVQELRKEINYLRSSVEELPEGPSET